MANAAGALACTRFGAQPSLPTATEIMELMDEQKDWLLNESAPLTR